MNHAPVVTSTSATSAAGAVTTANSHSASRRVARRSNIQLAKVAKNHDTAAPAIARASKWANSCRAKNDMVPNHTTFMTAHHSTVLTGGVSQAAVFTRMSWFVERGQSLPFGRMTAITSTAYSRDLGDELRRIREKFSPLTGAGFAEQLGWDPSKLSNIEKGKARASEIDLVQYLTVCGRDADYFNAFRERYRHAFDPYVALVPDNLRTLALTEAMAKKITTYDVLSVPGLIQTPEYARVLLTSGGNSPSDVEVFLKWRMDRQAILRRQNRRPECLFYVHELALQLPVGDARIMEEQYLRMLFNTHILRIVPMSTGPAVIRNSARMLFNFEKLVPVAYSETDLARVFAHDGKAIAQSREFFKWLDALALDEGQSRSLLANYVSGLREDPHVPRAELA